MTIDIAIGISVISAVIAVLTFFRNGKKTDTEDIRQRVERDTKVDIMLTEINTNTKEIKQDIQNVKDDIKSHSEDIVVLKQSIKEIGRRIDVIEKKGSDSDEG